MLEVLFLLFSFPECPGCCIGQQLSYSCWSLLVSNGTNFKTSVPAVSREVRWVLKVTAVEDGAGL